MNWLVIAEREFADSVRSKLLWGLVAFVAVMVGATVGIPLLVPGLDAGAVAGLGAASEFAAMLVPIVALVAAYLAVAGERESGSLRLLLGLEPSRATVVAGKFLGRAAVVAVGLGLGFALAGVVTAVLYGGVPVGAFGAVLGLTVLLGVAFVGIAVGISAATATRSRAMTAGITAYLGLALLWDLVPQGAYLVTAGSAPGATVPVWFILLEGLSPSGAYSALVSAAIHASDPAFPGIATRLAGPTPAYLGWGTFALVLLAWTVLPVLVGFLVFERSDLN